MTHRSVFCALATLLAVAITAGVTFPAHPFAGLLVTAGIVAAYSVTLPGPGWRLATRLARAGRKRKQLHAAAEHALWVDRMSLVAQMQKDAQPSYPHDCFCVTGIPVRDLEWFRDGLERAALEMQQEERERRRQQ